MDVVRCCFERQPGYDPIEWRGMTWCDTAGIAIKSDLKRVHLQDSIPGAERGKDGVGSGSVRLHAGS